VNMSGADMPAEAAGAVELKIEPKVEQGSEQCATSRAVDPPAPADAGQPELSKQDEAMSVTTVPDEAVKHEHAETGADGLQAQPAGVTLPGSQVGRGEVILTPAEAKLQKLQKGYTLEPVLAQPASAAPPVVISGKRERKSSKHFGNVDFFVCHCRCVLLCRHSCNRSPPCKGPYSAAGNRAQSGQRA
jgi:hypothetical protein